MYNFDIRGLQSIYIQLQRRSRALCSASLVSSIHQTIQPPVYSLVSHAVRDMYYASLLSKFLSLLYDHYIAFSPSCDIRTRTVYGAVGLSSNSDRNQRRRTRGEITQTKKIAHNGCFGHHGRRVSTAPDPNSKGCQLRLDVCNGSERCVYMYSVIYMALDGLNTKVLLKWHNLHRHTASLIALSILGRQCASVGNTSAASVHLASVRWILEA